MCPVQITLFWEESQFLLHANNKRYAGKQQIFDFIDWLSKASEYISEIKSLVPEQYSYN